MLFVVVIKRKVITLMLLSWLLQASSGNMQWTIIRPGGLKTEAATGTGVLTEDKSICGAINREDVADLVVRSIFSDKTDGKVGHGQAY